MEGSEILSERKDQIVEIFEPCAQRVGVGLHCLDHNSWMHVTDESGRARQDIEFHPLAFCRLKQFPLRCVQDFIGEC